MREVCSSRVMRVPTKAVGWAGKTDSRLTHSNTQCCVQVLRCAEDKRAERLGGEQVWGGPNSWKGP